MQAPTSFNHKMRVLIDYTNYRGERSVRKIVPGQLYFGHNEFHKEDQWLLDALDVEKDALRTFAMKDIHSWAVEPVVLTAARAH
jgi:predicted DNA-binding transcriptional regulator YafY